MRTKLIILIAGAALVGCQDDKAKRITEMEQEISDLKIQLVAAQDKIAKEKKRGDDWCQQAELMNAHTAQYRRAIDSLKEQHDNYVKGRLENMRNDLLRESHTQSIRSAAEVAAIRRVMNQTSSQPDLGASIEAPGWRYPAIHEAKEIVKRDAKQKWGENYRMVEHEIDKQMMAYEKLKYYESKRWSDPAIRRVLNEAGKKWGHNFNMVEYEVSGQLAAKSRLGQ